MSTRLPLWASVPLGTLCGAALGTIVASFYLALALRTGFTDFDMFAVWTARASLRAAHPEAFQVAFGAVGFGAVGLAVLAFSWTWAQDRDDYGSAHWQTKRELKANGMLQAPGTGFVCGKLGKPKVQAPFISASDIPHVMMVAPTRAGKGVGFVIPNLLSFAGSVVVLDVKGEIVQKHGAEWLEGLPHFF